MDHLPAARPPWRLPPWARRWFDAALAAVLLLPAPAMLVAGVGVQPSVLSFLQVLPLFWRRSHPIACFAAVALFHTAQVLVLDVPVWGQVAFPVAVYSIARYARPAAAAVAGGVGLLAAAVASVDWLGASDEPIGRTAFLSYFLMIAMIVLVAWALGTLGRTREAYVAALVERGERIEREAAQRIALAATEERSRIAREMHDVVAHGLSVIVVQADGARYAAEQDPAVATKTLGTIAETGREALTEMRRLLGLLRTGGSGTRPQPRLDDVAVLVAEAQETGATVRARLPEPGTHVPPGVALTAYRVVQEALTNVRKHGGPGAAATVEVDVGHELTVEVCDDGRGAASLDDGRGLGLVGMRERVGVHDGELRAGPRPGGGYRVWARIPL